jgi:hypothetical protein
VKALPRSMIILFGTPKRCVMSPMNFAAFPMLLLQLVGLNPLGKFVDGYQYVPVATWAVQNGPTESRPHMAKGHDGGIVCRSRAGR